MFLRPIFLVLVGIGMSAATLAYAAESSSNISLSLFRAVRISSTSISISFKTSEVAAGQIRYSQPGGSVIQLTDASPQEDHLFTMTELDPNRGYSFTISATNPTHGSNDHIILLAPSSIGRLGASIVPGVQELAADGSVVRTTLLASSTSGMHKPPIPWWVFLILLFAVLGTGAGYGIYQKRLKTTSLT